MVVHRINPLPFVWNVELKTLGAGARARLKGRLWVVIRTFFWPTIFTACKGVEIIVMRSAICFGQIVWIYDQSSGKCDIPRSSCVHAPFLSIACALLQRFCLRKTEQRANLRENSKRSESTRKDRELVELRPTFVVETSALLYASAIRNYQQTASANGATYTLVVEIASQFWRLRSAERKCKVTITTEDTKRFLRFPHDEQRRWTIYGVSYRQGCFSVRRRPEW